jgi:hypothetical protein
MAYVIVNNKLECSETCRFVLNTDHEEQHKITGQTTSGIRLGSLLRPEQLTTYTDNHKRNYNFSIVDWGHTNRNVAGSIPDGVFGIFH